MKFISKILSIFLMVPALFGLYNNDAKDTEEAYRENVEIITMSYSPGFATACKRGKKQSVPSPLSDAKNPVAWMESLVTLSAEKKPFPISLSTHFS